MRAQTMVQTVQKNKLAHTDRQIRNLDVGRCDIGSLTQYSCPLGAFSSVGRATDF